MLGSNDNCAGAFESLLVCWGADALELSGSGDNAKPGRSPDSSPSSGPVGCACSSFGAVSFSISFASRSSSSCASVTGCKAFFSSCLSRSSCSGSQPGGPGAGLTPWRIALPISAAFHLAYFRFSLVCQRGRDNEISRSDIDAMDVAPIQACSCKIWLTSSFISPKMVSRSRNWPAAKNFLAVPLSACPLLSSSSAPLKIRSPKFSMYAEPASSDVAASLAANCCLSCAGTTKRHQDNRQGREVEY